MIRTLLLGVTGTLLCLLSITALGANTPQFMNYQGRLTNSLGSPIDLTAPMTFTIYTDSTGGTPIWTETQAAVVVRNGIFTVRLGSVMPVSDTVFKSDRRWLEIRVGTDSPLSPRTPFVSVAYAFRSTYADSCNFIPTSDTLWKRAGDNIYRDTGYVGIGTSTPLNKLDVNGRVKFGRLGFIPSWPAVLFNSYYNDTETIYTSNGPAFMIQYDEAASRLNFEYAQSGTAGAGVDWNMGFVLRSSGNVGIGTTSPTERLQVGGIVHSTTGGFKFPDGTVQTTAAGAGNYVNLQPTTPGSQQGGNLNVSGAGLFGGNVGIGTTSPAKRLHVTGMGMVLDNDGEDIALWGAADAVEHNHYFTLLNATGRASAMGLKAGGVLISDSYSYADPGKNNLIVKGNVGVGNVSPAYPLDVTGSSRTSGTLFSGGLNSSGDAYLNENYVYLGSGSWIKYNFETEETYINSPLDHGIVMRCGDAGRKIVFSHDGSQGRIFSYGSMFLDAGDNTIWAERINPTVDGSFYLGGSGNRWGVGFFRDLDISRNVGIGVSSPTHRIDVSGGAYCSGTNWVNASDVALKDHFRSIDGAALLEKIDRLNVSEWNYKCDGEGITHIGPTAQDFKATFGVGADDKAISTVDPDGIALAAIKELNKEKKEALLAIDILKKQLMEVQTNNNDLRKRLEQLEQRLNQYGAANGTSK